MNIVNQIIRQRRKRKLIDHRNPLPIIGWAGATILSLLLTFSIFGIGWIIVDLLRDLPSIETVELLLDSQNGTLRSPTRFLDREGKITLASLENPAIERLWLDLPNPDSSSPSLELDSPLARVLLAVSEANSTPKLRIGFPDLVSPQLETISERLAYELLLWDEADGWRKIMRAKILAAQLDQRYGRQQNLIWYLNSAKFGPLVFGAETAAQLYFNKSASELDILESAALVSILENPTIHPFNAPEVVRKRTGDVMVRILHSGWLTPDEIAHIDLNKLSFAAPKVNLDIIHPTYVDLILQQLGERYPLTVIERGGWKIVTTIDTDLQYNLECTLATQMSRIPQGVETLTTQNANCPAALLLPGISPSFSSEPYPLQSQGVILDPSSNQILALASLVQTDNSIRAYEYLPLEEHVAGSILTPFVYLAAFSRGIQPATLQWDIPLDSLNIPPNLDGKYHGPIRARIALASDYLSPAIALFNQIGSETISNVIHQLGIEPSFAEETSGFLTPQQFFFSSKVSLLEIAQAYQILANQGVYVGWTNAKEANLTPPIPFPILLRNVSTQDGQTLLDLQDSQGFLGTLEKRPAISPELAYLVTHVLSDEAARWRTFGHPNPFEIGRRSAAKLGRSIIPNQFWAVGYTPQRLVAIWLGNEQNPQTLLKPSSVMNLWHAIMQYSSKQLTPADWIIPDNIREITVCDPSGMLPDDDCPATVNEIFISGFEPHQSDQLFQTYMINEQSGRLATIFTPLELVKEQRYMTIPPNAVQWAIEEGIPLPPNEYDVIQAPQHQSENVNISSPQMFSYVRGVVDIVGSATSENFQYYRLQVGEGLFPRRWIQVGEDNPNRVKSGKLGSWDTQGLNGLFTLQLQVVGAENVVETALLQLTVDNIPPTLSISFPTEGTSYSRREFSTLTFQIQATDNLGIERVDLLLDGEKIHTFTQPPYAFPWQTISGDHHLSVVGYDLAGNFTQIEVNFTITR
ncbi:MAG: PBP1A family penicillin-binding protein [Anaerolineales bacterium]